MKGNDFPALGGPIPGPKKEEGQVGGAAWGAPDRGFMADVVKGTAKMKGGKKDVHGDEDRHSSHPSTTQSSSSSTAAAAAASAAAAQLTNNSSHGSAEPPLPPSADNSYAGGAKSSHPANVIPSATSNTRNTPSSSQNSK